MNPPEIRIEGLTRSFGPDRVLNGLTFTIQRGRVNFIIGRSGEGKSVLLKHLVGLYRPDKGHIWYDDRELGRLHSSELKALRRRIGLLFQDGALFDSMSAGQNVAFPIWFHGLSSLERANRIAQRLLEELGLSGAFHMNPGELSAGERKRVALARALIMEPDVLFFDEPTTGLDPILSSQVDELIMHARDNTGATVVVVSHDIAATLSLADQVTMLHRGQAILTGPPLAFKESLLEPVMDFLSGEGSEAEDL
jgi:phospholipid/cholesterol/gamma-HCH transport system ATP-binding protein